MERRFIQTTCRSECAVQRSCDCFRSWHLTLLAARLLCTWMTLRSFSVKYNSTSWRLFLENLPRSLSGGASSSSFFYFFLPCVTSWLGSKILNHDWYSRMLNASSVCQRMCFERSHVAIMFVPLPFTPCTAAARLCLSCSFSHGFFRASFSFVSHFGMMHYILFVESEIQAQYLEKHAYLELLCWNFFIKNIFKYFREIVSVYYARIY